MIARNNNNYRSPLAPDKCLLLDGNSNLIARGLLLSPPEAELIQVQVIDAHAEDVAALTILQVVAAGDNSQPARLGRVLRCQNNILILEPLRELGAKVRQNLRVPVEFESFLYPLYPRRGKRCAIRSYDLSCGGIAFYANSKFYPGNKFEVVIPITRPAPLILKAELLRVCPSQREWPMYAAKFIQMIPDLEHKVREAVFSVQLRNKRLEDRPRSAR